MKQLPIIIALASLITFITVSQLLAHSGRTDKYGCHAGSKPYHCHNAKPQSLASESLPPKPSNDHILEGPITDSYLEITKKIKRTLIAIKHNPQMVKSCDEWIIVSKLMIVAGWVEPDKITDTGTSCVQQKGLNEVGREMVGLISQLPLE